MPTAIFLFRGGENLAQTLDIGNFTTNGQQIVAQNGESFIDLRFFNQDNFLVIANGALGSKAALAFTDVNAVIRFMQNVLSISEQQTSLLFQQTSNENYTLIGIQGITSSDVATYSAPSGIVIVDNSLDDKEFSAQAAQIVSLISGTNSELSAGNQNVRNTVLVGGKGITAKTDNTAYCNQVSIQESGNIWDNIVIYPTSATQDNTHTLQNKSGTLAHLSDTLTGNYTEKWTQYSATMDATWEEIAVPDAQPNSIIQIVCVNNSGNNDMGVRSVGSVVDRKVLSVLNSSLTLTVKTDNNSHIEIYAEVASDIDFFFSAQL